MSKRTELQANLFCKDCKLRVCDEQALGCTFRLYTKPNWQQKRKIKDDRKLAKKRAKETGRTKYFREYKREYLINQIIGRSSNGRTQGSEP